MTFLSQTIKMLVLELFHFKTEGTPSSCFWVLIDKALLVFMVCLSLFSTTRCPGITLDISCPKDQSFRQRTPVSYNEFMFFLQNIIVLYLDY